MIDFQVRGAYRAADLLGRWKSRFRQGNAGLLGALTVLIHTKGKCSEGTRYPRDILRVSDLAVCSERESQTRPVRGSLIRRPVASRE